MEQLCQTWVLRPHDGVNGAAATAKSDAVPTQNVTNPNMHPKDYSVRRQFHQAVGTQNAHLLRTCNDLVVNVREVPYVLHVVPARGCQEAVQYIECDVHAGVACGARVVRVLDECTYGTRRGSV